MFTMRPSYSKRAFASMVFAATVAAIAAAGASSSLAAQNASVTIQNLKYNPAALTVPVGTTVVWKNLDGEPHTVTSDDGTFKSEALDQNQSYSHTFSKPGVYKYHCTVHPQMTGSVTVK